MVEASVFFGASQKLTSIFGGEWPSFHDAELTDVHLWRGDVKAGDWEDSNCVSHHDHPRSYLGSNTAGRGGRFGA
jgi:hypothetical protein